LPGRCFVAGSTIEIESSSMLGTHSSPPIHAVANGFAPTSIRARTAPVAGSMRTILPGSLETHSAPGDAVIQSALAIVHRRVTRPVAGSTRSSRLPP
jgi:hypothetical protein